MHTFSIHGHEYHYVPHPASEGMQLSSQMTAIALGLLGDADLAALTGGDAGAMRDVIGAVRPMLADPAFPRLIRSCLAHTSRDGVPLRQDDGFDAAFRGNYGELYEAVAHVIVGNGFLPAPATLNGVLAAFLPSTLASPD